MKQAALFRRRRSGNQPTGFWIVVETVEKLFHPAGHLSAAHRTESQHLGEISHRQNAGNDFDVDARFANPVEEIKIDADIEKVLRDRPGCTRVQLAFQIVQIVGRAGGLGVRFRVCRNADFEIGLEFRLDLLELRNLVVLPIYY